MSVENIYISHLPSGISESSLKDQLVAKLPQAFLEPSNSGRLKIHVFQNNQTVTATVSGLAHDFERLEFMFRSILISNDGRQSFKVIIKPDTGEERDMMGRFLNSKPSIFRRKFTALSGKNVHNISSVIHPDVYEACQVFTSKDVTTSVLVENTKFDVNVLMECGGFIFYSKDKNLPNMTRIQFYSALEAIQALFEMNCKNNDFSLGKDGKLLPICDLVLERGFIPFEEFEKRCINQKIIKSLTSKCWRCKSSFDIIGINLHLNSLAGKCKCHPTTRYHWPDEDFTRLTPINGFQQFDHSSTRKSIQLFIQHYPIKTKYINVSDYVQILMPLLEEEHYFNLETFENENRTMGTLIKSKFIELYKKTFNRYAWKLEANRQPKAWIAGNPSTITTVTLKTTDNLVLYGRLHKIMDSTTKAEKVDIYIQVKIPSKMDTPLASTLFQITAQTDSKLFYETSASLNGWMINSPSEEVTDLRRILLNPCHPLVNGWKLPDSERHHENSLLFNRLNYEQKKAYERAFGNRISVICGPPGTGKSKLLSTIVIDLAVRNKNEVVLICCPSNFACDGIITTVNTLANDNHLDVRALRILSKQKEMLDLVSHPKTDCYPYPVLHRRIRSLTEWNGSNDGIQSILEQFEQGKSVFLSKDEMKRIKEHEEILEKKIVKDYNVIVCTVSSLIDNRIFNWIEKKDLVIYTTVLDEGAQLSQTGMINLLKVKSKRLVIAGDHLQLQPSNNSYASQIAGLNVSLMEQLSWNENSNEAENLHYPSWTTLVMQYRMHPQISSIVSKLTYCNLLKDSVVVTNRQLSGSLMYVHKLLLEASKKTNLKYNKTRRVAILDHDFLEVKEKSSFKNSGEAKYICRLVRDFLKSGVAASEIIILTLYEAQRLLIQTELLNTGVLCTNVDAFQGREANIIILSLVRNNVEGNVGFLKDQNRLNVAISRSKEFLVVAGSNKFYNNVQLGHWKQFNLLMSNVACIL